MRTRLTFLTLSAAACAALLLAPIAARAAVDSVPVVAPALAGTPVLVRTCAPSVPCGIGSVACINEGTDPAYVQLFDQTTVVTPGSSVPDAVVGVKGGDDTVAFAPGWRFFTAVQAIATTTPTGATPATPITCTFGVQ